MAIYYIDTNNFSTATAVWTDSQLITKAPDGFYSFGDNFRQQFNGLLLSITSCGSPPPPPVVSYAFTFSQSSSSNFIAACEFTDLSLTLWGSESSIFSNTYLFADSNLAIPFDGESKFRKWVGGEISNTFQIGVDGQVLTLENC